MTAPYEPFDREEQLLAELLAATPLPHSLAGWEPTPWHAHRRSGLHPLALALLLPLVLGAVAGGIGLRAHFSSTVAPAGDGGQPPARSDAALAWDAAYHVDLLFGGRGAQGDLNDTWAWNGAAWTQMHPATSPPPMSGAAMAFDQSENRIVLVGAGHSSGRSTWTWDGSTWHELTNVTPPGVSDLGPTSMVYDEATHQLLLAGVGMPDVASLLTSGRDTASPALVTYVWSDGRWALSSDNGPQLDPGNFGLAWDAQQRRVTLVQSGIRNMAACGQLNQLGLPTAPPSSVTCYANGSFTIRCTPVTCPAARQWAWTRTGWTRLPDGPYLGSVTVGTLATDATTHGLVHPSADSMWGSDRGVWSELTGGSNGPGYSGEAVAPDFDNNTVVVFGGRHTDITGPALHTSLSSQTWTWDGRRWSLRGGAHVELPPYHPPTPHESPSGDACAPPADQAPVVTSQKVQDGSLQVDLMLGPVAVLNAGDTSCTSGHSDDVEIDGSDGHPLQITGNPMRLKTTLTSVIVTWANWCGSSSGAILRVRVANSGVSTEASLHSVPSCTAPNQPSTLTEHDGP